MSSAYTSPSPSQLPVTPPLHKSLNIISTIHEYEPLTDNTELLEDTVTVSSTSRGVQPTAHSAMPQPHEAEVTPRDGPPSEQMKEGHAFEVGSQSEVAAEVTSGNLNPPFSVSTAEPSSNADRPSAVIGNNGLLQENSTMKGEMDAPAINQNSVTLAEQAKKNGHGECDDKAKPEATVAERTEQSPADTTPALFLDETTTHTNERAIIPSSPPAEGLRPSEAGGTEVGKEAPEHATVAHGDVIVLGAVPASGHDSAKDAYKNPAKTEEPTDITPTLVPNETTGHSENDAPCSSQQELPERLHETLTAVTMVDSAKVGSTGDPSTGDQDPALPLSAETTVVPTSNNATGELKEEALPTLVDVENLTFAAQCQEPAVKGPGWATPSKQEGWTTSAVPVHEAQAQTPIATHTQDLAPAAPAEDVLAQSVGLSSAAPDSQVGTKDPVVPPLPFHDRPEATSDPLVSVEASTAASPPEKTAVDVQTEAGAAEASEDRQTRGSFFTR